MKVRLKLTAAETHDWDNMRDMSRDFVGKRKQWLFKQGAHQGPYKRFKRRLIYCSRDSPVVSPPVASGRRRESGFDLDTVCQRLELDELDSPPRSRGAAEQRGLRRDCLTETAVDGCGAVPTPSHGAISVTMPIISCDVICARGRPATGNAPEQGWTWRAADEGDVNAQQTGSDEGKPGPVPFTVLDKVQGESMVKLAAPSLLNDFYTNVLDCSSDGLVALALGSSVYLWNSETQALMGRLCLNPQPGRLHRQSISSLCWSRDGRALCFGTKSGEIQLWDVEKKQTTRSLPSHFSAVGALSWKQQLISSGSVLGCIHHLDPRAPAPLVGAAVQTEGICSLQWSPGDDWLASGSTDGLLHIWDSDVAGHTRSKQPVKTMKQPSAVKSMGWCPWQGKMIATGGGWKDGELRIWDTQSGTCVTSANTNSQICSLRWAEKKQFLVTGHGRPHHQITRWTWEFPSLNPVQQLTGHSHRVLHLALNPDDTQVFSAGVDHRFHIWDI
ncbi:cell division cycle protein 20 homolog B-like [Solea solea]|uniref:cell division cycle protein 20 homolog B-like n=1 Tax=Solea solea TaxID=90069 RepID=UPI00272DBDCC|nr:cell division cycle protein 20 homolog B-like [Solea solea]